MIVFVIKVSQCIKTPNQFIKITLEETRLETCLSYLSNPIPTVISVITGGKDSVVNVVLKTTIILLNWLPTFNLILKLYSSQSIVCLFTAISIQLTNQINQILFVKKCLK